MNREEYKKERAKDFRLINILIDQHNQSRTYFEKSEEWYQDQSAKICEGCDICRQIQSIGKKYYGVEKVSILEDQNVRSLAESGKSKSEIKQILNLSDRELAIEILKLPLDLKMNLK